MSINAFVLKILSVVYQKVKLCYSWFKLNELLEEEFMWPRWVRALATVWVAWDSRQRRSLDWFWVLVIFLLGPLLLPFYLATRPLIKGEHRVGGIFWNLFVSCESLFSWLVGLAAAAVLVENVSMPYDKSLAEVKRAEIKAGSLIGVVLLIVFAGLEKMGFELFREHVEKKYLKS